ncbi:MAG: CDP-diacylglycerol--serine O-phosphatidyltransferase [Caldiserica bacterium]|nr:MAG: CDP-diacylglycerol--serine O-phosphatidyltransferase [Caldisericota bacterium]
MVKKKGVFIPSFFTAANLFFGILSIFNAINGDFKKAGWFIIVSWFLDILDGRIARATKTTSEFGLEFDSLADMVSFGVAPAILCYLVFLKNFSLGWVPACVYILSVALRLARYNTSVISDEKPPYFIGLPSPGAASFLAIFVILYLMFLSNRTHRTIPFLMKKIPLIVHSVPLIMFILSFLMISQLRYSNFSKRKLTTQLPYRLFILILFVAIFIYLYPENSIFIILSFYILSGIIDFFVRLIRIRRRAV